jgi:hypothetical protein
MTIDDLILLCPKALFELTRECVRQTDKYSPEDDHSQHAACCLLVLRSASVLRAAGELLKPDTFDSWDILNRAFLESRDLLTTFRFDDEETRTVIQRWFKGQGDTWKPNHKKCEKFLESMGAKDLQLAKRWGLFSGIAHPTHGGGVNSAAILIGWCYGPADKNLATIFEEKKADYIGSIVTLIATACYDFAGFIPLGFDLKSMPTAEQLRVESPSIVIPILNNHPQARHV